MTDPRSGDVVNGQFLRLAFAELSAGDSSAVWVEIDGRTVFAPADHLLGHPQS